MNHMTGIAGVLIAVGITLLVLSIVVVALRVWSRVNLSHNFAVEDILMIICLLLFASHVALSLSLVQYGIGDHISDIHSEHSIVMISKLTIPLGAIFVTGVGVAKISILLFYLKTFIIKAVSTMIIILIALTSMFTIAFTLVLIFPCNPLARSWDPLIAHGYCVNRFTVYYVHGAFNLFIDFAVIILPLPLIWKLRVPKREKVVISLLVTITLIAVLIGSARFYGIYALEHGGDITWHTALGIILGQVEFSANIICGSIIVMRPFFRKYIPSVITSSSYSITRLTSSSGISIV